MDGIGGEPIGRLVAIQTRNGSLGGDDLRAAADEVAALALSHGFALRACDDTGERMVGAALVLHPACVLTDTTGRLDGLDVLLVSGAVAGPFGLTRAACLASNLGARTVRAAVLGGWPGDVAALDGPVIEVGSRPALDVPFGRATGTRAAGPVTGRELALTGRSPASGP